MATRAHAQPSASGFTLALQAPADAGCVSAERLVERVEARVGRSAHASGASRAAALAIDVMIEPRAHGHRARVVIRDPLSGSQAQREIESDAGGCGELDEPLVLVLASSIGVAVESVGAPATQEEQPREVLVLPMPQPEVVRAPGHLMEPSSLTAASTGSALREPPTRWHLQLTASARVLSGLVPGVGVGLGLGLSAERGLWGLRVAGSWLPELAAQRRSEVALRTTGALGELAVCVRAITTPRVALLFCGGVLAGALHVQTIDLWRATPRWDAVLIGAPSVVGRVALASWWGLGLELAALVPWLSPRYEYTDSAGAAVVAHAPSLGLAGQLAVWVQLGS
ncbi:MAG: hypothetical protein ABW321_10720 [Polyangiales bacterium]